jgi:hypothetical protein
MDNGRDSTQSFPFSLYCYTSLQPPLQQPKALVTPVKVITWSSLPMLCEQHGYKLGGKHRKAQGSMLDRDAYQLHMYGKR